MLFKSRLKYILGILVFERYFIQVVATSLFQATTGGIGCQYGDQVGSVDGFAATFYSYPNKGTAAGNTNDGSVNTAFFETGYSQYGLQGSTTGITLPSIQYDYQRADSYTTDVFGVPVTVQHFLVELDGYFYAKTSGVYTLELNDIDDYAAIWFGKGLDCCDTTSSDDSIAPDFATGRSYSTNTNGESSYSIYLSAGSYYPIKIRYVNVVTKARLGFSVVDPSNNKITNFEGYIYQFINIGGSCTTVTATLPLETTTVTTDVSVVTTTTEATTYTSGDQTITSTVVVVEEPPLSTTTVTTDVSVVTTTTEATTYTSGDQTITSTVVVVEEPQPSNTLTTTSVSSITSNAVPLFTTTATTDVPVASTTTEAISYTSNGQLITSSIVVVEEPSLSNTSTTVSSVTYSTEPFCTTTVTTDVSVVTTTTAVTIYTSGYRTITSSIVVIEEPSVIFSSSKTNNIPSSESMESTSFAFYGNTSSLSSTTTNEVSLYTTTITTDVECASTATEVTVFTLNGKVTTSSIIIVEEPHTSNIVSSSESEYTSSKILHSSKSETNSNVISSTTDADVSISSSTGGPISDIFTSSSTHTSATSSNEYIYASTTASIEGIESDNESGDEKYTLSMAESWTVASVSGESWMSITSASISSEQPTLSPSISVYEGAAAEIKYDIFILVPALAIFLIQI